MDDLYGAAYERLYNRLPAQVGFYPEARGVGVDYASRLKEIISDTQVEFQVRLRSDAQYLLAVLLLQMVVMPIAIARPSMNDEVWNSLVHDVETLISTFASTAAAGQTEPEEVSGHTMLDAISSNWASLRTTRFRLWGD
jgi:hypothetical protein